MKKYKKLSILIFLLSILAAMPLIKASAAPQAYGAGTVSAAALNVREEPGTTGAIAATIKGGSTVVILDIINDSWYHISCGDTEGYVAAMYISDAAPVKNFTAAGDLTGDNVRLRSEPSTSGAALGTYPS